MKNLLFAFLVLSTHCLFGQAGAGKICLEGNRLFIVIPNEGFSIYDVSQPASPSEIRFVECPGIQDIAVRDEFIYANRYQDLYLLKVPKDRNMPDKVVKWKQNVFPSRTQSNPERAKVQFFSSFEAYKEFWGGDRMGGGMPLVSVNGSMSALALGGDCLYVVDSCTVKTFIAKPTDPEVLKETDTQEFPEYVLETTWTPGGTKLYVGSKTGIFIFDNANRQAPKLISIYKHKFACDPVVVSGNYAYSTLRSGNECTRRAKSELVVIDVSNPEQPVKVSHVDLVNPFGLAIQGNTLAVCDGFNGLQVFDVRDPKFPKPIGKIDNIQTYDVLINENLTAFVSIQGNLNIYSLQQPLSTVPLSIIPLQR